MPMFMTYNLIGYRNKDNPFEFPKLDLNSRDYRELVHSQKRIHMPRESGTERIMGSYNYELSTD